MDFHLLLAKGLALSLLLIYQKDLSARYVRILIFVIAKLRKGKRNLYVFNIAYIENYNGVFLWVSHETTKSSRFQWQEYGMNYWCFEEPLIINLAHVSYNGVGGRLHIKHDHPYHI